MFFVRSGLGGPSSHHISPLKMTLKYLANRSIPATSIYPHNGQMQKLVQLKHAEIIIQRSMASFQSQECKYLSFEIIAYGSIQSTNNNETIHNVCCGNMSSKASNTVMMLLKRKMWNCSGRQIGDCW